MAKGWPVGWELKPELPCSLPDDLHQHPFPPATVGLTVEDPLPGTEVQLAVGDGDDQLAVHDLSFQVGISEVAGEDDIFHRDQGSLGRCPRLPMSYETLNPR